MPTNPSLKPDSVGRLAKRYWVSTFVVCIILGLIVASAMTFLDWWRNPGGIFHGATGTEWFVVMETATSWFFPAVGISALAAALGFVLLTLVKRGRDNG